MENDLNECFEILDLHSEKSTFCWDFFSARHSRILFLNGNSRKNFNVETINVEQIKINNLQMMKIELEQKEISMKKQMMESKIEICHANNVIYERTLIAFFLAFFFFFFLRGGWEGLKKCPSYHVSKYLIIRRAQSCSFRFRFCFFLFFFNILNFLNPCPYLP